MGAVASSSPVERGPSRWRRWRLVACWVDVLGRPLGSTSGSAS